MHLFKFVSVPFVVAGAMSPHVPPASRHKAPTIIRELDSGFKVHPVAELPYSAPNNTLSLATTMTSPTPSGKGQPPPPPPYTPCNATCHCATGGKPVPTEGRYLCGWCAAVSTDPAHFLNVTDVVLCKDNGCCNFGFLDGRCEKSLEEQPVDLATWCPWPVNELDPPNSTTTQSSTTGVETRTPVVTVPWTTNTSLTEEPTETPA
ncbi:hypothetical protein BU26DRAFT_560187 [Trematosphaeria pertusa]|uniref:Uncharacterized protein n=1 Tax=Trematosphaeria pertusa TaxID=390896 RepID=A0A6A6ITD5_9PLEO|nr:uncharacterized protein BU26DRAFT_560187 [Trematosphaeria pertusa]KAF2252840.1 hypothetical protein BU26DRAFT_560187 [Trematosphaeria pertusa]